MKVFITGGTGFVGNHVIDALLEKGHQVRVLVRPQSVDKLKRAKETETVFGEATELSDLIKGALDCDAIIHLIGIIREFPKRGITFHLLHTQVTSNIIYAAKETGISRLLHMSALGARPDGPTAYLRTKFEAQELVLKSGLEYTIFRPSIIFGEGGEAIRMFADMVQRRVVPIVGNGKYRYQPINVKTVAQSFERALYLEETKCNIFDLGGPEEVSYNNIMDTIARVMKKKIFKIHIPVFPLRILTSILQRFPDYPLTTEQITMLLEGSTCNTKPFYETFGLTPIFLERTIQEAKL
jgi:NADH dehydrogenase